MSTGQGRAEEGERRHRAEKTRRPAPTRSGSRLPTQHLKTQHNSPGAHRGDSHDSDSTSILTVKQK